TDGGGGVAVDADAQHAFVAPGAALRGGIHRSGVLVDLDQRKVLVRAPTGGGPGRVSWSSADVRIYVSDAHRGTVSVLSAQSGVRLTTLKLPGGGPLLVQPGLSLIFGTDAADILRGSRGGDRIEGFGGDDVISGGRGDDTLIGDAGNDHINGSTGNDTIDAGDGNDVVTGGDGKDNIELGPGDD